MKSNSVLHTSGPDLPYWEITKDAIAAYAERVGATLNVMAKRATGNPQWAIFDAMATTPTGELGGWVDADIVISTSALDIFRFGKGLMVCEPGTPARVHPKWMNGYRAAGAPNPRPYPVTAIVAWTGDVGQRVAAWVAEHEESGRLSPNWGDQEVLALAIWELDFPMHYFPSDMHRMLRKRVKDLGSTQFAHAAGGTRRPQIKIAALRKMKQLIARRDGLSQ